MTNDSMYPETDIMQKGEFQQADFTADPLNSVLPFTHEKDSDHAAKNQVFSKVSDGKKENTPVSL